MLRARCPVQACGSPAPLLGNSLPPTRVPSPPVDSVIAPPCQETSMTGGVVSCPCSTACLAYPCYQGKTCFRNHHELFFPYLPRPSHTQGCQARRGVECCSARTEPGGGAAAGLVPREAAFLAVPLETAPAWK